MLNTTRPDSKCQNMWTGYAKIIVLGGLGGKVQKKNEKETKDKEWIINITNSLLKLSSNLCQNLECLKQMSWCCSWVLSPDEHSFRTLSWTRASSFASPQHQYCPSSVATTRPQILLRGSAFELLQGSRLGDLLVTLFGWCLGKIVCFTKNIKNFLIFP